MNWITTHLAELSDLFALLGGAFLLKPVWDFIRMSDHVKQVSGLVKVKGIVHTDVKVMIDDEIREYSSSSAKISFYIAIIWILLAFICTLAQFFI